MAKIKFEFEFDTETGIFSVVNTETGEIQEVKTSVSKLKSTKKTTKKEDNDPIPKIVLEENKYSLNQAAATLLLNEDDENRLEIKFMKYGKNPKFPTICNSNNGNKVTKSNTVACRGKANSELAESGTVFTLQPFPGKSGVYLLCGDTQKEPLIGDDNVEIVEEDEEIIPSTEQITQDDDLNLDDFKFDEEEEISSLSFSL